MSCKRIGRLTVLTHGVDADAPKPELGGDGAGDAHGGSELQEPNYSVEVKLSDLQGDPNNPLFSVKTFEDLGL